MPLGKGKKAGLEVVVPNPRGITDDVLFLEGLDGRDDGGCGEGVAGVGEAAGEDPLVEGGCDVAGDDHAADGYVAGVHAFGEGDEVRGHIERVKGEPVAGTSEAGHDLVQDHHDAVLVAQCADAFEIAGGGYQDAGRAGDGFQQHGRNRLWALGLDDAPQVVQGTLRFLFRRFGPELGAVEVRAEDVDVAAGIFVGNAPPVTGGHDRRAGVAVVGAVPGDDLVSPGVQPGHPDGVLVRVGAAVGEEHLLHVRRCMGQDLGRCRGPDVVGVRRCHGGEAGSLLCDGRNDLGVLVADVGVHQLAGEVKVRVAVVVPHGAPGTAGDRHRVEGLLRRPGVEDVRPVQGDDVGIAYGAAADYCAGDCGVGDCGVQDC